MYNREQKALIEPWADSEGWDVSDFANIETPCYVVDEKILIKNLEIRARVQKETDCKILMALKGFSMFSVFPLVRKYLCGTAASSLHEARLGFEEFGETAELTDCHAERGGSAKLTDCHAERGGEVHVFSPAYPDRDFDELMRYADHIVFNSFSQWKKFGQKVLKSGKNISCGIRVNPEHSEVDIPLYNPCGPYSRLGVIEKFFKSENLDGIDGLHFHCLCENNAEALERTLKVFEKKFGQFLSPMKWVNFGGGHHITRKDYNIELLCRIIRNFKSRHPHLEIYLEPGEAIALNAGVLVATVLDIIKNKKEITILDVSAACHMPDVIEEPYRPTILGAEEPGQFQHTYRLAGPSCLAGDIIGDYSFKKPLSVGENLVFLNMAIYTMVKNNTFNGISLPSIILRNKTGKMKIVRKFGYEDFKNRLS